MGDAGFGSKVELYGVKISTVKNYSTNSYASEQFLKKRGKFKFLEFLNARQRGAPAQAASQHVRSGPQGRLCGVPGIYSSFAADLAFFLACTAAGTAQVT